MLGIHVIYTMKPGKRDAFLAEIAACGAREAVLEEAGCIQYDYFLSAQDPDQLLLVEKWTDREAQKAHMTQPHMAQVADIKARFAVDTKLEFYDC